jgi:hypothetical protein
MRVRLGNNGLVITTIERADIWNYCLLSYRLEMNDKAFIIENYEGNLVATSTNIYENFTSNIFSDNNL